MANDKRPATPEEQEQLHQMLIMLIDAAIARDETDITIEFGEDTLQVTSVPKEND
jgi:hypothetical protein